MESGNGEVRIVRKEGDNQIHLIVLTPDVNDSTTTDFLNSLKENCSISPTVIMAESSGPTFCGAKAANKALSISLKDNPEFIAISNNDIKFESDVFDILINKLREHRDVGYIVPLVRQPPDFELSISCTIMPRRESIFLAVTFSNVIPSAILRAIGSLRNRRSTQVQNKSINNLLSDDRERFVSLHPRLIISSQPFVVLRSDVLRTVGLIDELFLNGLEDFDLAMRTYARGYKIGLDTSAILTHYSSLTGGSKWAHLFPGKNPRMVNNWRHFYNKYTRKEYSRILDLANRNNVIL